ncbi:MAG TPA: alpha/beta hydrolase-fold protein [Terriglobia bacterium]|nr:alpha/beta hydrolase-fold protein [Terriglobia bacterium]
MRLLRLLPQIRSSRRSSATKTVRAGRQGVQAVRVITMPWRVLGFALGTSLVVVLALGPRLTSVAGAEAAGDAPPSAAPTSLQCGTVASTILGRSVSYCVALPADYNSSTTTRYPTLYYLHGLFEHERSWGDRGGQQILNGLLESGQAGEFLVVCPDGGKSFYVNSFDGKERYEDFFVKEFVPSIDRMYRTRAEPAARGLSGDSMGGYGALHLGMRHPDLFGSVSAQSAALLPKFPDPLPTEGRWGFYARVLSGPFGSPLNETYFDANNPLILAEHPEQFSGLKLYFDCGDHDRYGFQEGNELLDRELTEKHVPHEFHLREGDHGWSYLSQYMKYSLLFQWHCFEQAGHPAGARASKSQPEGRTR